MFFRLIPLLMLTSFAVYTADNQIASKKRDRETIETTDANKRHEIIPANPAVENTNNLIQICNNVISQSLGTTGVERIATLNFCLLQACKQGAPLETIKTLHENGAELNASDNNGTTSLHIAAKINNHILAQFLLKNQCAPSLCNNADRTPLHHACKTGSLEVARLLIKQKAKINIPDTNGLSPLLTASLYGHIKLVKILLLSGCDRYRRNIKDQNPLHVACISGKLSLVKFFLINRYNPYVIDGKKRMPIDLASKKGHLDIVAYFFKKQLVPPSKKNLLLHQAVYSENTELLSFLTQQAINIDHLNDIGDSPLHIACRKGLTNAARCLLQHNANPSIPDIDNYSPLHIACLCDHIEIVRMLVEDYGCEITPRCMKIATYKRKNASYSPVTLGYLLHKSDKANPAEMCTICRDTVRCPMATTCCFSGIYCNECLCKQIEENGSCPCCRKQNLADKIININAIIKKYEEYRNNDTSQAEYRSQATSSSA